MQTTIARLVALGLILSACSSPEVVETTTSTSEAAATSTSVTTIPTTNPPTTTTSGPILDTSIINGLPVDDAELMERRVLAVKIDNHPRANPQTGIELAEMIIELRVEGITRFISLWHHSDAEVLGPMRSGRPTDGSILAGLNEPTFAISGAQDWVRSLILSKDVNLLGESGPPATFRDSSRNAPHNLYVSTTELRAIADARGYSDDPPPAPLWEFAPLPLSAADASSVTIDFGSSDVVWSWNPLTAMWSRTAYGEQGTYVDVDGEEQPVERPVLIALIVEQYTASPPAGVSGKSLPASRVTGSGEAYVFADGKYTKGTWERETEDVWFTLLDENGEMMSVPAGQSWVSLVPTTTGLTIQG